MQIRALMPGAMRDGGLLPICANYTANAEIVRRGRSWRARMVSAGGFSWFRYALMRRKRAKTRRNVQKWCKCAPKF
jgi:hypothetical protein